MDSERVISGSIILRHIFIQKSGGSTKPNYEGENSEVIFLNWRSIYHISTYTYSRRSKKSSWLITESTQLFRFIFLLLVATFYVTVTGFFFLEYVYNLFVRTSKYVDWSSFSTIFIHISSYGWQLSCWHVGVIQHEKLNRRFFLPRRNMIYNWQKFYAQGMLYLWVNHHPIKLFREPDGILANNLLWRLFCPFVISTFHKK